MQACGEQPKQKWDAERGGTCSVGVGKIQELVSLVHRRQGRRAFAWPLTSSLMNGLMLTLDR